MSLSVFHFGLFGTLWKNYFLKKIKIFFMEENYSVHFASQLELQGWKMLPHQLEMEKTRIETVSQCQSYDEMHAH